MKSLIQKLVDRFRKKPVEKPEPVVMMAKPPVSPVSSRQSIGRAVRASEPVKPPPRVYEWNGPGYTVVEDPVMSAMFSRHYQADSVPEPTREPAPSFQCDAPSSWTTDDSSSSSSCDSYSSSGD